MEAVSLNQVELISAIGDVSFPIVITLIAIPIIVSKLRNR
ncbi:hypothetical protein M2298_001476 [Brevibacillus sp. 1238]|jgi:hypothetical protein|uniref:Uncharacterized protein n=1 Tax=Brevibacillus parabrevis TaxID=54914 RepID=A0A4Y3PCZ8_BREPA|nr:hypothetical protein [Brevibacillus sp. 1238]GEB32410.1 hypothetical protein BPA01_19900 [Brevibacillus parabrevis]